MKYDGVDPDDIASDPDAATPQSLHTKVHQLRRQPQQHQLKTAVNKVAGGAHGRGRVLQDLKQLMQTITGNTAR